MPGDRICGSGLGVASWGIAGAALVPWVALSNNTGGVPTQCSRVGGVSVAEARKQKAAEGDAARKAEEARYKQSAKDLDTMKKNAVGKDDKDINDDIVGGVNIGEARKQKAREGEEARQAEEDRYKQSAKDLAAMKKNTAARTDHDLLDDPV